VDRISQLELRKVRAGDGEALYALFMASIHALAVAHYTDEQMHAWTSHITPARLEARLMQSIGYVAERDGQIVGFASLDIYHAELDFLYVDPEWVRQGIGRRLTDVVEWEATRHGLRRLELTASLNARVAYERLGFEPTREITKKIGGVSVPCVRMAKDLVSES
jgi:putative acetyltransferase